MIKWHLGPLAESAHPAAVDSLISKFNTLSIQGEVCQEHIPFSLRNLKVTCPVEC